MPALLVEKDVRHTKKISLMRQNCGVSKTYRIVSFPVECEFPVLHLICSVGATFVLRCLFVKS